MSKASRLYKLWKNKGIKKTVEHTEAHIRKNILQNKLLIAPNADFKHTVRNTINRPLLHKKIGSGIDIMKQDWDNLIIFDSYRADLFEEHSSFEGELTKVTSKGSWSLEFVIKNFQQKEFHDTICVTANPYYHDRFELEKNTFFKSVDTGHSDNKKTLEKTTKSAITEYKRHPNKRLLIHYMQPHAPHLGKKADRLRDQYGEDSWMFSLYANGSISKETLDQTYLDTVRIAESSVKKLVNELDGKTVITSDHGENLGEVYHGIVHLGHGFETPECRLVPWLELSHDKRRKIVESPPLGLDSKNTGNVEERLSELGYI